MWESTVCQLFAGLGVSDLIGRDPIGRRDPGIGELLRVGEIGREIVGGELMGRRIGRDSCPDLSGYLN